MGKQMAMVIVGFRVIWHRNIGTKMAKVIALPTRCSIYRHFNKTPDMKPAKLLFLHIMYRQLIMIYIQFCL
jgi:hypothetical protein